MKPAITKLYPARAIGDFGDDWIVDSGTKVDSVNNQLSPVLYTPSPESPFEIAIAMRSNIGTPEVPGIVFDPVHFTLDPDADTAVMFEKLYSKDSNGNDWTLDMFNPVQLICYNHDYGVAQSFKFARQGEAYPTLDIRGAGFRVWAKISNDPIGRKVMVFELKKILQYTGEAVKVRVRDDI